MIPHQLHIKNFLSYGPDTQIIDFSNYHLICLSGKNGHGKSAMLDAITWAIWGQARKSSGNSKPDAGLLHLGQKHMMVILEFEVNGQHYRVRREYLNTTTKPFATLDFGVKNAEGKLTALTDKTIKDTQEKIERTIGITYESFTNSTFLRQGQSNEFSKKSPKERKDILAQILQLQKFENQKKIAQQHARKLSQDVVIQTSITERIEQELKDLSYVSEHCMLTDQQIANNHDQLKLIDQEKIILDRKFQELQKLFNQQAVLLIQQHHTEELINKIKNEIKIVQDFLNQDSSNIDLSHLQNKKTELTEQINRLQKAHQKKLQLKEAYLSTKEKLHDKTANIAQLYQTELQNLQLQQTKNEEALNYLLKQLETETKTEVFLNQEILEKQEKINNLKDKLETLQTSKQNFQKIEQEFEHKKNSYQNLDLLIAQLTQKNLQFKEELHQISTHQESSCQRCMQPINHDQQQTILNNLQKQHDHTTFELTKIQTQKNVLKIELTNLQKKLQNLAQSCELLIQEETKYKEYLEQFKIKQTQVINQQNIVTTLQNQTQNLKIQITTIQTTIKTKHLQQEKLLNSAEIQQLKQQLLTIEQEGKALNFQITDLQKAEQELLELNQILKQHQAASDTSIRQNKEQELIQLNKNLLTANQQLDTIQTDIKRLGDINFLQANLKDEEKKCLEKIQILQAEQKELLVNKGSLQQKQQKIVALESEHSALEKTLQSLKQELSDYQEIAKALGKDGIQALLIEQAIPEIEYETNQILARLTNNQTQIFIESLRDLKKGGSKETLDIKISDSFGLRDYEMFSGGEAFRIDFALRIGISKLLARRAGTTLQTIFIDEGFGSQDEEGLQLIMDNIYKIQDDFAKIIIVSHLPEMKEQFPVQFIIEKKRCGSTVAIVHQG